MKKRWVALLLVLVLLCGILVPALCVSMFGAAVFLYPRDSITSSDFSVVAHRGLSALAPENTLAAFRLAGEYGFWGTECDVQPTADGHWAIMHDDTVDRMTDGTGEIIGQTYDALLQYNVDKGNFVSSYPEEKIPTLSQYLDVCLEYGLVPVIEIKRGEVEQMASLAIELLERPEHDSFVLISFLRDQLKEIRTLMPHNEMYLLTKEATEGDIRFCLDNHIDGLDFNYPATKAPMIAQIQDAGLKTAAWTIDMVHQAEALYQCGVRIITTNRLIPNEADGAASTQEDPLPRAAFTTRIRNFFAWLLDRLFSLFR